MVTFPPEFYDEEYFEHGTKSNYKGYNPEGIFHHMVRHIKPIFRPRTVLDVGCAYGFIPKIFELDLAIGVDFSYYAMKKRVIDKFILASADCLPFKNNTFDLVTCIETLEHLTEEQGYRALCEIDRVGRKWIFLSIPRGFSTDPNIEIKEKSHINIQLRSVWLSLAESLGWSNRPRIEEYLKKKGIFRMYGWNIYVFKVIK